jgi:hypothetical protein
MARYRLEITFDADDDEDAVDMVDGILTRNVRNGVLPSRDVQIGDLDLMKARYEYARSVRRAELRD